MRRPNPSKQGEINSGLLDRFTVMHYCIGVVYGYLGLSFHVALVLAILWEVVENPLKAYVPKLFPHATADTRLNFIGDILAICLGWISSGFLR